ncbi:MAG: hypothetical protein ACYSWZ_25825, partial [Planctomycetota bacterium]
MINDTTGVEARYDCRGPRSTSGIPQGPRVAWILNPVYHVWVHVLAIAGRVMAHGVEHDRRMIPGCPHIELGNGIGRFPFVLAKVRLRKGHEHSHIICCGQDLCKAQMCSRLAAVVVRIDEIDPEALKPLQTLPGCPVVRPGSSHLGIVQWNRGQKDAAAVQEEIPAVNPELTKTKTHGLADIQ